MSRLVLVALLMILMCGSPSRAADREDVWPSIGMTVRLIVDFPGPELKVKDLGPEPPIKVEFGDQPRLTDPSSGMIQYDLKYTGYEPDTYDLGKYLERKDGGYAEPPVVLVKVVRALPSVIPGDLEPYGGPAALEFRETAFFRGLVWPASLWAASGLVLAVAFSIRQAVPPAPTQPRRTDELARLIRGAMEDRLTAADKAALERRLRKIWLLKYGLAGTGVTASEEVTRLREHAAAGPLVDALQRWIHTPDRVTTAEIARVFSPFLGGPDWPDPGGVGA
jgi:hypothetical protein